MSFCTVVNCIDGRVQLPVIEFLKKRFKAEYVDCITESEPVHILAGETNRRQVQSILDRIEISVKKHKSNGIAVAAHHDCAAGAADPASLSCAEASKTKQFELLDLSLKFLRGQFPAVAIIGLWVDENSSVNEISSKD